MSCGAGKPGVENGTSQGLWVPQAPRCGTRRLRVVLRQNGHRLGRQRLRTAM